MNVRVLKKYSNRRLYDIQTSSYVAVQTVRQFIQEGASVQVVDAQTSEDLTCSVLLQIVQDADASGQTILSAELLQQVIRLQTSPLQKVLTDFLSHHMNLFMDAQKHFQKNPKPVASSMGAWNDFVEQQSPAMQALLAQYLDDGVDLFLAMQQALQQPELPSTHARPVVPMPTLKKRGRKPAKSKTPEPASEYVTE